MTHGKTANMQLPLERMAQIADLRQELGGVTNSAAIGQLLTWARETGRVKHGIPGIFINAFPNGLAIGLDETEAIGFSADNAVGLIENIRELVQNGGKVTDLGANYRIARKGNGVILSINGITKSFSLDVALELADLIYSFCEMMRDEKRPG